MSESAVQKLVLSSVRDTLVKGGRGESLREGAATPAIPELGLDEHELLVRSQKIMRRLFPWKLGGTDAADSVKLHFVPIGKRNNNVLQGFSPWSSNHVFTEETLVLHGAEFADTLMILADPCC